MSTLAKQPKSITVAIVALNEEILIEETVRSIEEQVRSHFTNYELILINDGSTDKTPKLMEYLSSSLTNVRTLHNDRNRGLGYSFQRALKESKFDYFTMLCGDGGLPAESLPNIFRAVGTTDLIIPHITNLNEIKTLRRYLLSKTYTGLMNLLFRQRIHYYNGLSVYKTYLLRQINIISTGFGFQGEIITKLLKAGCTYKEVQVLGSEKSQKSKAVSVKNFINVGKTFWNLIWEVAFFNPNVVNR